jgi:hypothetical protein
VVVEHGHHAHAPGKPERFVIMAQLTAGAGDDNIARVMREMARI